MKKTLFLVAAVISMAALSGCQSNKAPEQQPMAGEEVSSAPIHHDYKGEKAGK